MGTDPSLHTPPFRAGGGETTAYASETVGANAAGRLRRLHRLQLMGLAVFAAAMLAAVAGFFVFVERQDALRSTLSAVLHENALVYDDLREMQVALLARKGAISRDDVADVLAARARLGDSFERQQRALPEEVELRAAGADSLAGLDELIATGAPLALRPGSTPPVLFRRLENQANRLSVNGKRWADLLGVRRVAIEEASTLARRRFLYAVLGILVALAGAATLSTLLIGRARERLLTALQRAGDDQRAVGSIATAATWAETPDELVALAAGEVAAALGASDVAVTLMDTGPPEIVVAGEVLDAEADQRLARFHTTICLAVDSVNARRRLERQAVTDPLTDLPNHRAFQGELSAAAAVADRHGGLALALIDLDDLRRINDAFGHEQGDRVLRELAHRLQAHLGEGAFLARIGGGELALIHIGDLASATAVVEELRIIVRSEGLGPVDQLTVSAGVAELSQAASPSDLLAKADSALRHAKASGRDRVVAYGPEVMVNAKGKSFGRLQALAALRALARTVDARDPNTQRHSERVATLAHRLALDLGWSAERAAELREAALVHDVGKVGVPDAILLKPGALSRDEREMIETHSALGATIVSEVLSDEQVMWVRGHHERLDGAGYPDGLAGTDIPEGARIMAVADTWDAMTADRPYRAGMETAEALRRAKDAAGTQHCPTVVAALVRRVDQGGLDARRAEPTADS